MKTIRISDKIKEYRQKKGMSQERFGSLLGVSAQAVSKWERDMNYPDVFLLSDLAEILDCSVDDFFVSSENEIEN